MFLGFGAFGLPSILAIVACLSAGVLGGMSGRGRAART